MATRKEETSKKSCGQRSQMESEGKQRKELVMNRLISLLGCVLVGIALCGCQTTQTSVRLGECPLKVEAWFPPTVVNGMATVSINDMKMGTMHIGRSGPNAVIGDFSIRLAPGTYMVSVTSEGYESRTDTVTIVGKEHVPCLRMVMKPATPAPAK